MHIQKKHLHLILIIAFSISIFAQPSEKPELEVPDVIIHSRDRSQVDWMSKQESPEMMGVNQPKEVPPSDKVDTDILMGTQKENPVSSWKLNKETLNRMGLFLGNIDTLAYHFLHGQNFSMQTYLLSLQRKLMADYVPYTGHSIDDLSYDYSIAFGTHERLSFSAQLFKQEISVPSDNTRSSGTSKFTQLPLKLNYTSTTSKIESWEAEIEIESIDVDIPDHHNTLFAWQGKGGYHTLFELFQLNLDMAFNNHVSKLAVMGTYASLSEPWESTLGLEYYFTRFSYANNSTLLTPRWTVQWIEKDLLKISGGYQSMIEDINYGETYTGKAVQMNERLGPETILSRWNIDAEYALSNELKLKGSLKWGQSEDTRVFADTDNNGFLEPLHGGASDLCASKIQIEFQGTKNFAMQWIYHYQNIRLRYGGNLPGKPLQSLLWTTQYTLPSSQIDLHVDVHFEDQRPDELNPSTMLPRVLLVNAGLFRKLSSALTLRLNVYNIFNSLYFMRSDVPEPGARFTFGGEVLF